MVKIKIILITVFLVLTHFSCTKDKNGNQDANNTIPQVQVDLYLNLNEPKDAMMCNWDETSVSQLELSTAMKKY